MLYGPNGIRGWKVKGCTWCQDATWDLDLTASTKVVLGETATGAFLGEGTGGVWGTSCTDVLG